MNLHNKKDFQDCMLSILEPLKPYYSEEKARLTLGVTMAHYDIGATWMEAFSRPLWGLVPFWAGGGKEPEFEEIYRKGLTAGTDEKNPEYWGECTSFDQRFVEMAAISYGIMFAPQVVWDPLTEAQKENLCNYLNKINEWDAGIAPRCWKNIWKGWRPSIWVKAGIRTEIPDRKIIIFPLPSIFTA